MIFLTVSLFFLISYSVLGQELNPKPMLTDRPDQTECPYIVPKGSLQIELGFLHQHLKLNNIEEFQFLYPSSLFKYGLLETLELRLVIENNSIKSRENKNYNIEYGFNPVQLGFKIKIFEESKLFPEMAFIFHLGIPDLASANFKTPYINPKFRFTFQHNLTKKWYLGYNLGLEWNGENAVSTKIYTLTTGWALNANLGTYIETYGFLADNEAADHRINAGLTYYLKPNFMIDVSSGLGLSKSSHNEFIGLGCSFRLPN